ncbi:hypothetical protein GMORB2_5783 [Geosmithia morbida]|uniref:Uncharacterized protein n=1 Tax=Geosmithia morbida TaxID=1094350 RepID=A0A9P5D2N7_9HYPO|nr:uncharacterized protein GMORB2_5783 [Geosmithia morbida]KAF4124067.1 hypothetical protein GMORB2_5783 [Geosmithia morbida]
MPPRQPNIVAGLTARGAKLDASASTLTSTSTVPSSMRPPMQEGPSRLRRLSYPQVAQLSIIDEHRTDDDGVAADASSSSTASTLNLHINSSIRISNGNNLVCLTESPARHANAIAEAVTRALHLTSSGHCGIPMVDGNGNPRPIQIDVDAGLVVDGVGNVLGNEKMIDEVLKQRRQRLSEELDPRSQSNPCGLRRRRRERDDRDEDDRESEGDDLSYYQAKRRRSQ